MRTLQRAVALAEMDALALAVAPPAFLAATNPRFSAAPVTAIMVFFGPTITHAGPIASAFERSDRDFGDAG